MVPSSGGLLGMYGVVACIFEWLCGSLSFWSVFVDFHCCHCRLTSFYSITSFFVSYYLTIVIPNMMLYSINSDAAVVRRPPLANYCFVYTLSFSFLFLFMLFLLFFYKFLYSFGFIIASSSLSVQIGVGSPAAFVVSFLLACYHWLLNTFPSCLLDPVEI